MYGMVNEGIRTYILREFDEQTWQKICKSAGLNQFDFEKMTSYDDGVTYELVGAICDHTGLEAAEVLKIFGEYWVEFAGASNFGHLMRMAGDSFLDRVRGLDDMHERILLSMPHLTPPSFELEETDKSAEGQYILRYFSEREGLAHMVIGLLHGLAQETGDRIEVNHITPKSETSDHDVFQISLIK